MSKGIIRIVVTILLLAACGFVVYYIVKYTNYGTESFKSFQLSVDGEDVLASSSSACYAAGETHAGTVTYIFDFLKEDTTDYSVGIAANAEADFDYEVDERLYQWSAKGDLSEFFNLTKEESSFTFTVPTLHGSVVQGVLEAIYEGQEVVAPSDDDVENLYLFTLTVSSYDASVVYTIDFCVDFLEFYIPDNGEFYVPDAGVYFYYG